MKKFALGFVIGLLFAGLLALVIGASADAAEQRPGSGGGRYIDAGAASGRRAAGTASGVDSDSVPGRAAADDHDRDLAPAAQSGGGFAHQGAGAGAARLAGGLGEAGGAARRDSRVQENRQAGVRVSARRDGTKEYYVATAADRVFMSPEDELDVKGLRAELMFVKGTLDKLGVGLEFEHVGKYKDAPDMFTKTAPSPETLEVENGILDQYYGDIINVIAEGRKKQPDAVKALIDDGPFVGTEALNGGLVDALLFEDEMYGQLKDAAKRGDQEDEREGLREGGGFRCRRKNEDRIHRGPGRNHARRYQRFGIDDGITATGLVKLMREVENDASIKGVILRIDSPGGDGIASDDILHEAKVLSSKKPTIISMSRPGGLGWLLYRHDGRPGCRVSQHAYRLDRRVFRQGESERACSTRSASRPTTLTRGKFADIDSRRPPADR